MSDLISREALRKAFHERIHYFNKSSWDEANAIIDNAPTVQIKEWLEDGIHVKAEEKPTPKWIVEHKEDEDPLFRHRWVCPVCKNWNTYGMPPYCMYCGVRLEKADGQE